MEDGMTKITRLNKACAIIFANLLMTGVVEAKMQNEDLWQFISHLSTSVKTVNVNTINRFALPVTEVSQNDNFVFYTSDAVKLASGATLSAFDLRVNKNQTVKCCLRSIMQGNVSRWARYVSTMRKWTLPIRRVDIRSMKSPVIPLQLATARKSPSVSPKRIRTV
jgi:LEA14-like dessication related protein